MDYISKDEAINLLEHNDKVFHYADRDKENIVYDTINTLCRVLIEMKAADVQPVNQWISVKDKLPDEGEKVLIYAPRTQNQYYVAMFYTLHDEIKFAMNVYGTSYCWYAEDVTHWQPLPEPPKDGDTE